MTTSLATSEERAMNFAAYIPVGPTDLEVERAVDVIDSIAKHDDAMRWVIVIDDSCEPRDIARAVEVPDYCTLVVLPSLRQGLGQARTGGLCAAGLAAAEYAQRATDADFLLKLDTDSLVINSLHNRATAVLMRHRDAGLFGVIGDSFGENRTFKCIEMNEVKLQRTIDISLDLSAHSRSDSQVLRWWGVSTREHFDCFLTLRALALKVRDRGHRLGQYCQGGGYILTRSLLDALAGAGAFINPLVWRDLLVGEDLMFGLQCAAAGLSMHDVSGQDQIFAVAPGCLSLSRKQLVDMNCSVIHSIKGGLEAEVRDYFRLRRTERATSL
jgi:hypothetical protein